MTGTNNEVLFDGTYHYTYDNDGNRVLQFASPDSSFGANASDITVYVWDQRNRLTSATLYANYTAYEDKDAEQVVAYTYNYADQQIRRTLTVGSTTTYVYSVYDGSDLYLQISDPNHLAVGTNSSYLSQRYLYGPGGQALATDNLDFQVYWGLGDAVGTVRDVVQYNAGTGQTSVQDHRTYTSFGVMTQSNAAIDYPFGFEGAVWDSAVKLDRNGERLYDPLAAVWISADPLGLASNDPNLERYCRNNPITGSDPSGLCTSLPSGYSLGAAFSNNAVLLPTVQGMIGGTSTPTFNDLAAMASAADTNGPQPITWPMPYDDSVQRVVNDAINNNTAATQQAAGEQAGNDLAAWADTLGPDQAQAAQSGSTPPITSARQWLTAQINRMTPEQYEAVQGSPEFIAKYDSVAAFFANQKAADVIANCDKTAQDNAPYIAFDTACTAQACIVLQNQQQQQQVQSQIWDDPLHLASADRSAGSRTVLLCQQSRL